MGGGAPSVPVFKPPDAAQEYQQSLAAYVENAPALLSRRVAISAAIHQMQQGIMGSNIDYYTGKIEQQMPGAQAALQNTQNMAIMNAINATEAPRVRSTRWSWGLTLR